MGRKPKNSNPSQPPQPNPQPNPKSETDSASNESEILVEDHKVIPEAQPDSAWEKIKSAASRSGLFADEDDPRIETRGRKKKTAATDEFSTLIVSVSVLILSFSNMPEQIKPNDAELRVLANHLSGLMLRHLPISSKFSADSLDIIGILAVLSGYYARVSPALKELRENKPKAERIAPAPTEREVSKTAPGAATRLVDDIERLSPSTARFLDEVEKRNHDNKNN
jgi:hypothetical protein